jgi:tetratricopeptide (TPR) repeat protein
VVIPKLPALALVIALGWASSAAAQSDPASAPPAPSAAPPTAAGSAAPAPLDPAAPSAPAAAALDSDETLKTLDEAARLRFIQGRTRYEEGRFEQAAEEFALAYKLSGRPQLLYNLYVAHRDAAQWPQAIEALRSYLEKVPEAPDRINLEARLKSMQDQAARLEEERAQAERERRERERLAAAPVVVPPKRSKVPWVLIGSGGSLLAASVVTGVLAKRKDDDLDAACADDGAVCPKWLEDDANAAYSLAVTTDVLWSIGAASALTGIVLWLTGALDRDAQPAVANLGVSPRGVSTSLTLRY